MEYSKDSCSVLHNDGKVDGKNKSAVNTSFVVEDENVLEDAPESINDLSVTLTQDYVNAVTEDICLNSVVDFQGNELPELEHNMETKEQIISQTRNSILRNFDPLYSADYTSSVTTETLINIKEKTTFTESFSNTTDSEDNLEITEMDEVSEQINRLEEEVADLKLQLNASQQIQAMLELQLTQKEEILIKSQRESLRKDQCFKQEMKQLKDNSEEKNSDDCNTPLKELQETIKSLKLKITSLLGELAALDVSEECYKRKMNEYEETLETQVSELQKLIEEECVLKQHLATLELALSDVFQKYERSKKIIEGYKCNEDALRQSLTTSENTTVKSEQKYESLKAHAKAQLEKSNQELLLMREQYDAELHKVTAKIRRLEISHSSFTESLDQKSKECAALAFLLDELTGELYSN